MRLTKTEIAQHRAVLESWQKPSLMLKRGRALMRIMGSEDLFTQPGVGFIFEAWAAGQFAKGRSALRVRLVSAREQWPDFEVKTRAGRAEPWEFTEVQHPRRRRGDEYRKIA